LVDCSGTREESHGSDCWKAEPLPLFVCRQHEDPSRWKVCAQERVEGNWLRQAWKGRGGRRAAKGEGKKGGRPLHILPPPCRPPHCLSRQVGATRHPSDRSSERRRRGGTGGADNSEEEEGPTHSCPCVGRPRPQPLSRSRMAERAAKKPQKKTKKKKRGKGRRARRSGRSRGRSQSDAVW
jgi:hypothetical protein